MSPRSAAEVALGVAGIWLMVSRIPEFDLNLALWPVALDGLLHWVEVMDWLAIAIAQIAIGLLLFLGARCLAQIWRALRGGRGFQEPDLR